MELEALLSRGYFPRELPPTFTTSRFGKVIASEWAKLASRFADKQQKAQKGWLPSLHGADYVGSDARFKILRDMGVQFFDNQMIEGVSPTKVAPSVGIAPIFSL